MSDPVEKRIELIAAQGLRGYLAAEQKNAETSQSAFKPELEAVCELYGLYETMAASIAAGSMAETLAAEFFLLVNSQLCGATSQLLRRRVLDAHAMNRQAIEATAVAHRLWQHPDLIEVFIHAYPHSSDHDHPKQWRPSPAAQREFSTKRLFNEEGPVWSTLKSFYDVNSTMAVHAGMGALVPHEHSEGSIGLEFIEKDDRAVLRGWYVLMTVYYCALKVLLRIFRKSWKGGTVGIFEADMKSWNSRTSRLREQRAPWIGKH
jgi:hypothetical protein